MNSKNEIQSGSLSRQEQYIGFEVQDRDGDKFGHVHHLWTDDAGNPLFVGVTAGWLFEHHYIIPADAAEVNEYQRTLRLPYTKEEIKNAPHFVDSDELAEADRESIYQHYGVRSDFDTSEELDQETDVEPPSVRSENMRDTADILLKEEQLKVGKRQVSAGGVRLRKIVRTETVNQPVELEREEIVIERVPTDERASDSDFGSEDIFIPLRREEAVVEKTARVREKVRVGKKSEVDRQDVSEQVRKEELKVDRDSKR